MLKDFDQSQGLQTITKKCLQFYMPSAHRISVIETETRFCYMEVGWKSKDEYIYCFMKFSKLLLFKPNRSIAQTIVKLAPSCIPTCSKPLLLSFLSGPLLNCYLPVLFGKD